MTRDEFAADTTWNPDGKRWTIEYVVADADVDAKTRTILAHLRLLGDNAPEEQA